MARTLYTRLGTDQALGAYSANYEKSANYSSAAASSLVISGHTTSVIRQLTCAVLEAAHNASDWPVAAPVVNYSIDVTATSNTSGTNNGLRLARVTSDGATSRGNSAYATLTLNTTGIKTGTCNNFDLNGSGSRAQTDVGVLELYTYGSASMTAGSLTIDDSDSFLTLNDFVAPSTAPRVVDRQRRALQAVSRASVW